MPKSKSELNKTYYEKNYDKIYSHLMKKCVCLDCNCEILYCHFSRHTKTKKHLKNTSRFIVF